jgi:hypothetical protein
VLKDPNLSMQVTVDGEEVKFTVDGTEIKSNRIIRAISPPFFTVTLPEENAFDPFVPAPGVPGMNMRIGQRMGCG